MLFNLDENHQTNRLNKADDQAFRGASSPYKTSSEAK